MTSKDIEKRFDIIRTLVAIGISLGIALIIIIFVSKNPANALYHFIIGPATSFRRIANTVELAIPLTFCGLGMSIIFMVNQSNMSVEGAFFMSCAVTTIAAVTLKLPPVIHPLVCLFVGSLTGIGITGIPSVLKVKWGANELVSSLMLNYICFFIAIYLIRTKVLDSHLGVTGSREFQQTARLIRILPGTRLHLGLVFVILAVFLCWLLVYRTKTGYAVRVVGQNAKFAKYAGINVGGTILLAQALGGFLAGFGGATEMLGMYSRFQYQALTQYGFDGMLIAIIAGYNPALVPTAALFLAYVRTGADIMNRNSDVPLEIISVIQAIIIMLVVAKMFLNKFKHSQIVKYSRIELKKKEDLDK
jgi:simple sugar transport system permease protein